MKLEKHQKAIELKEKIPQEKAQKLEKELIIVDYRTLEPYQKDHCMFICKNK